MARECCGLLKDRDEVLRSAGVVVIGYLYRAYAAVINKDEIRGLWWTRCLRCPPLQHLGKLYREGDFEFNGSGREILPIASIRRSVIGGTRRRVSIPNGLEPLSSTKRQGTPCKRRALWYTVSPEFSNLREIRNPLDYGLLAERVVDLNSECMLPRLFGQDGWVCPHRKLADLLDVAGAGGKLNTFPPQTCHFF
jgi:hypothetical protein